MIACHPEKCLRFRLGCVGASAGRVLSRFFRRLFLQYLQQAVEGKTLDTLFTVVRQV